MAFSGRPVGRPIFWTEEKVATALIAARGMPSEAARILSQTYGRPCCRQGVMLAIMRSQRLKQIQETCLETVLDVCESQVMVRAELGDQKDQHFLLLTKGKARGYTKHTQISGIGPGGSIPVVDLTKLSDDELADLEKMIEKAA